MPPIEPAALSISSMPDKLLQKKLLILFGGMTILGMISFILGISGADSQRAWQAYLINFVYWTGLAAGTVLFSAILSITHAGWGRPIKRLAEAPGTFLPIALFLFLILYGGSEQIFPWISHPVPEKSGWLNLSFLFFRNGLGLLVLVLVAMILIYLSVRREINTSQIIEHPPKNSENREETVAVVFSNVYGILYAVILSMLAFDLIMSLSPHWFSSLFGVYYFIGSFFSGLAAIMILSALAVKKMALGNIIRPKQMHNLGKLQLGFTLLTGDFFFTQFLVIWYGNLPEETHYVILRSQFQPWAPVAWTVLGLCFILPFLVLLNQKIKMQPLPMLVLSGIILCGMWLDKFLLIAPSLQTWKGLPFGFLEIFITAGFLGIMALCILLFLQRFPIIPYADPLFQLETAQMTDKHELKPEKQLDENGE